MGLSILTNNDDTEAVIINDSVLPPQPIPFVFSDNYEPGIREKVDGFLDWVKDIRKIVPWEESDSSWAKAIQKKWDEFLGEGVV